MSPADILKPYTVLKLKIERPRLYKVVLTKKVLSGLSDQPLTAARKRFTSGLSNGSVTPPLPDITTAVTGQIPPMSSLVAPSEDATNKAPSKTVPQADRRGYGR